MGETIFLELGRELFEFERDKCYQTLNYHSFNSYLASSGVDISPRTAYRLKAVYKKYVLEMELEPLTLVTAGYTKLSMIAEQVDENNVSEWIAKAETLSRADIIRELKDGDPDYKEPPLVKLLDVMNITYWLNEFDTATVRITDCKLVQQGSRVSVSGRLVDQQED